jgi:hypothetical protein
MDQLRPLSLVFFARKRDPITVIMDKQTRKCLKLQKSAKIYTHVGIVISRRVCDSLNPLHDEDPDTLYLWESTLSSPSCLMSDLEHIRDAETNGFAFGVQIRRLADVLGVAAACKIDTAYTNDYCDPRALTPAQLAKLSECKHLFTKRRYTTNPFTLVSAFKEDGGNRIIHKSVSQYIKNGTVFSSQFATLILQALNIIPCDNISAETMLPHELANPRVSDNHAFRAAFGNHIMIHPLNVAPFTNSASCMPCRIIGESGATKLLQLIYQRGITRSLRLLIERLPLDGELGHIVRDVGEIAVDMLESANAPTDSAAHASTNANADLSADLHRSADNDPRSSTKTSPRTPENADSPMLSPRHNTSATQQSETAAT